MITTYYSKARERALQTIANPRVGSWVVAAEPSEDELDQLAEGFTLDRDSLTDAVDLYESQTVRDVRTRFKIDGMQIL